jgi:hypothetical protein
VTVTRYSATVLEEAIESLSKLRTPYWLGDAGVRFTLAPDSWPKPNSSIAEVVQHARDQELPWTDISQLLGIQPATAARRSAGQPGICPFQ